MGKFENIDCLDGMKEYPDKFSTWPLLILPIFQDLKKGNIMAEKKVKLV